MIPIDQQQLQKYGYGDWGALLRAKALTRLYGSQAERIEFLLECKRDRIFLVNALIDQKNPRAVIKDTPFFPHFRQREMFLTMEQAKLRGFDMVWLKSRNVGLSWGHMIDDWADWYFKQSYTSIIGSRVDDLVDPPGHGNMLALFPKFDYIYQRLPGPMKFSVHNKTWDDENGFLAKPYAVTNLRTNPINGNNIIGETVTSDYGAGGRADKVLIDEHGRVKYPKEAWTSCGQTTSSRHSVSTPQGQDFFWGLACPDEYQQMSGAKSVEHPEVFRIDWRDLPRFNEFWILDIECDLSEGTPWRNREEFLQWKNSVSHNIVSKHNGYAPIDWPLNDDVLSMDLPLNRGYDDGHGNITHYQHRKPLEDMPGRGVSIIYPWRIEEGFRYSEEEAAQELDISFNSKKGTKVYSIQYKSTKIDKKIQRIEEYPLYVTCDPGGSRGNAFYMLWQQWNPVYRNYETLDEIFIEGRSCYFFLPFLTGNIKDLKHAESEGLAPVLREKFYMMQDSMWRPNMVYGDPNGLSNRTANTKYSIATIWRTEGIPVVFNHEHRFFDIRIRSLKRILKYLSINPLTTPKLNAGISNVAFPKASENSQATSVSEGYVHHPIFSHPTSAEEFFACYDPHQQEATRIREEISLERRYTESNKISGYHFERRKKQARRTLSGY